MGTYKTWKEVVKISTLTPRKDNILLRRHRVDLTLDLQPPIKLEEKKRQYPSRAKPKKSCFGR